MYLALDPGTKRAGAIPDGGMLSAAAARSPDVDLDQILASLDADTRSYLLLLLSGGAQAFRDRPAPPGPGCRRPQAVGRAERHVQALRAARPRHPDVRHAARRAQRQPPHRDPQPPARGHRARRRRRPTGVADRRPRTRTSRRSPPRTPTSRRACAAAGHAHPDQPDARQGADASPRSSARRCSSCVPFAHALGPALKASRPLFHDTTPVIQNQLRPFSIAVQPLAKRARARGREARPGHAAADALGQRPQHAVQHARLPAQAAASRATCSGARGWPTSRTR